MESDDILACGHIKMIESKMGCSNSKEGTRLSELYNQIDLARCEEAKRQKRIQVEITRGFASLSRFIQSLREHDVFIDTAENRGVVFVEEESFTLPGIKALTDVLVIVNKVSERRTDIPIILNLRTDIVKVSLLDHHFIFTKGMTERRKAIKAFLNEIGEDVISQVFNGMSIDNVTSYINTLPRFLFGDEWRSR